jgi:hypothetical protein
MTDETPKPPLCCNEATCHRRRPFLFLKTPDPENKWLLVTHYHIREGETEADRKVEVLERHDVTHQIEQILIQYRQFLDAQLEDAMKRSSEAQLAQAERDQRPGLWLPGGGA